jgi:MarR family transcriptional regulator, 2-MHQ and catechol-resistance regulon repressor
MMLVSGPNLSGVAKRLAKVGLILRKNDPNDERITLLEISPKGKELLKNISVEIDRLVKDCLQDYSPDQISEILTQLRKCN